MTNLHRRWAPRPGALLLALALGLALPVPHVFASPAGGAECKGKSSKSRGSKSSGSKSRSSKSSGSKSRGSKSRSSKGRSSKSSQSRTSVRRKTGGQSSRSRSRPAKTWRLGSRGTKRRTIQADRERSGWESTRRRVVQEATRHDRRRGWFTGSRQASGRSAPQTRLAAPWRTSDREHLAASESPPREEPDATDPPLDGVLAAGDPDLEVTSGPVEPEPEIGLPELPVQRAGLIQALRVDLSTTWWTYLPLDSKGSDSDWSEVETEERYQIPSLQLYRVGLTVGTRWANIAGAWQSNLGLDLGGGQGRANLLNLMVALGIPGLERLSFEVRHLDFEGGRVALRERATGEQLQTASFRTEMSLIDGRFELWDGYYVSLRYSDYALPRNVYLGLKGDGGTVYRQVSDQLLSVESRNLGLGLGYAYPERLRDPDSPFVFGGWAVVGGGPYTLRTLAGQAHLDEGSLLAVTLGLELGLRFDLGAGFGLALRNIATLTALSPLGLSKGLERDVRAAGADPEDFELGFGVSEVINQARIELSWTW